MREMKKLSEKELCARAQKMYFDKNPNIKEIFVNEFGQFSYKNASLEEINKHREVKVFLITREGLKNMKFDENVLDLTKEEDVKKLDDQYKEKGLKGDKEKESKAKGKGKGKSKDIELD